MLSAWWQWCEADSASSPPRTNKVSPVWVWCLFCFLKQDFGKTREASSPPG